MPASPTKQNWHRFLSRYFFVRFFESSALNYLRLPPPKIPTAWFDSPVFAVAGEFPQDLPARWHKQGARRQNFSPPLRPPQTRARAESRRKSTRRTDDRKTKF